MGTVYPAHAVAPLPYPAPTIVSVDMQGKVNNPKPLIIGVAKSNAKVIVYVDGIRNGSMTTPYHPSGTSRFVIPLYRSVKPGAHRVRAKAISPEGKESGYSNDVTFTIATRGSVKEDIQPTPLSPVSNTGTSTGSFPELPGVSRRVAMYIGAGLLVLILIIFFYWLFSQNPPEGPDEKGTIPPPPSVDKAPS